MKRRAGYRRAIGREAELVLLCAALKPGEQSAARIASLARGGLGWEKALRIAHVHGVMPLLYRNLAACADAVPQALFEELKRDFYANLLRNRFLAGELARLARLFEAAGVGAIAYKGPTLAEEAYGDLAMRQFADLDILVKLRDFPTAAALLRSEGYSQKFNCEALATGFFQASKDIFVHPDCLRQIDLHWRLSPRYFPFAPDPESLWPRARAVQMQGTSVTTLAPEDLMLVLCAHAARHGWICLTMVCDIAEMIRSHRDTDWRAAFDEASRLGSRRIVVLGFYLARELLGAEIPAHIESAIASDPALMALGDDIARRMFEGDPVAAGDFQPWKIPLRTIEGNRGRIRYCLDRALGPTVDDALFADLPGPLLPLHYLLRPIRLALARARRMLSAPPSSGGKTAESAP